MSVEAGQPSGTIQHHIEYAGGEEHAPPEEVSPAAPQTSSQFLESARASQTAPQAFTTLENTVPVGLRRFSHPTTPVAPLIERDRLPVGDSGKRPSSPVFSGPFHAATDDGRQFVAEAGTSTLNMLEFFRAKILHLEDLIVNLTAFRREDRQLLETTAAKVDRVADVLEMAASSLGGPDDQDLELRSSTIVHEPRQTAQAPIESHKTVTGDESAKGGDTSSGYESDTEEGRASAPPPSPEKLMHPWDPEVWPLLRTSSTGSEADDQLQEQQQPHLPPSASEQTDIMEDVEAVMGNQDAASQSPTSPARSTEPQAPASPQHFQPPRTFDVRRRYSVSAESLTLDQAMSVQRTPIYPKMGHVRLHLRDLLQKEAIFRHVDPHNLDTVVDQMRDRIVEKGDCVIRQREYGDEMFLVDSGTFEVLYGDKVIATVGPGQIFGEISLMYNCPRTASVRASQPSKVWVIDRSTFRSILMQDSINKRQKYEKFLNRVALFSPMLDYERARIADALEPVSYQAGDVILTQGDTEDDRFFVIEDGSVEFWKKDDSDPNSKPVLSGRGGPGDYFGELSLLTARPRQATAIAKDNVTCLTMRREDFNRLMGPCEDILQRNMSLYANYQQLIAQEAERLAQAQLTSASDLSQHDTEAPVSVSKSDLLHSLTLLQCIIQDFLVATIDEALSEFAEQRIQLTGDTTHLLGQIMDSIQEVRKILSFSVSEMDSALRQLEKSDDERITAAFAAISLSAPCFLLYEQIAKSYFTLRAGADTGKILASNGENELEPLSQQQLDYLDTLLSHPSNIVMSLSEIAPQVQAVLSDIDAKLFSALRSSFSAAYDRFMDTKASAVATYEALRNHPGLVDHMGLRAQRVVLATARATIINDDNPSDAPEVQVIVFSDYIAFIGDSNTEDAEKKSQALPLWGCVLHLNETDHRADLHSSASGLVASFKIIDQTPEWLLKLRDAIEIACGTSPLLVPTPAKSA